MSAATPRSVAAVIPVYDDWESLAQLLERLDAVAATQGWQLRVLVVDDGSTERAGAERLVRPYRALLGVEVLRLARNLGHQRALAIGLTFVHQERRADAVCVLDGDGEDRPEDLPVLLAELDRHGGRRVVFAERARRSEGALFQLSYFVYRTLHRVLTGVAVRVGNFSVMPFELLGTFVVVSEAWNHYAAAVFKARIPYAMVPIARGTRLAGRSRMNFVHLVTHGLSAISVFGDVVGVRLLIAGTVGLAASLLVPAALWLAARAGWCALPEQLGAWTLVTALLSVQLLLAACALTFSVLSGRNNLSFLPLRDFRHFVAGVERVHPRP